MSVGVVDKQTGDRIPTAGMPAIDDALDLTSVNPVQNDIITAALANKQDKTDNNLQTTDKTVVGAINEHEGDISSLKSGLTNLDTEVNGDATVYPYADVITIEDAVPSNLADCSVKIEPVQDLHGYDKPWVGGAGKNKCPLSVDAIKAANSGATWTGNSTTINGVAFTILTDNDGNVTGIYAKGATTASVQFRIAENIAIDNESKYTWGGTTTWDNGGYGSAANDGTTDYYPTTSDGVTIQTGTYDVSFWAKNGRNIDCYIYPMIRLATETDATFAPYTNICPISGHTEVDVQRDGKNLLNPTKFARRDPNSGDASNNWAIWEDYIRCNYNDSLTLNCGIGHVKIYRVIVKCFDKYMNFIDNMTETYIFCDGYTFTINIPGTKYCSVLLYNGSSMADYDFSTAQLELGSTATPYEPYQGKTYTISLGDTIYGGTVDFDSGVMTVTHGINVVRSNNIDGETALSNNITRFRCALSIDIIDGGANSVCSHFPYLESWDDPTPHFYTQTSYAYCFAPGKGQQEVKAYIEEQYNAGTPITICSKLKNTFTVQLTPEQIQLLQGQNTLTASTGDISVTVNGVSGSIGTVQEQVNDHEERIEAVESGLTNLANDTTTIQTLIALDKTTIVSGGYVQIGKAVIVTVSVTLTGNAGAVNAEISGFPITINDVIIHVRDGSDYTKVTTARISNGVLYFDTAMTAGDYVLSGTYILIN